MPGHIWNFPKPYVQLIVRNTLGDTLKIILLYFNPLNAELA